MTQLQSDMRARANEARMQMGDAERKIASGRISNRVTSSALFPPTGSVGCYLSLRHEVDTQTIVAHAFAQNLRVFVPVVKKNFKLQFRQLTAGCDMKRNSLGIREPVGTEKISTRDLDLVIVPLVAFDTNRNRIGMGGGYYDREFAWLAEPHTVAKPRLVGVAFDCQKVEEIAPNPWDIRLFSVFTESRQY